MSRNVLIERAQEAAFRGMVDTCEIKHVTGETHDDDGNIIPTYADVYTGPCRVQQVAPYAERSNAGQAYLLLLRIEVQLPLTVLGLMPDDVITMTYAARDPDLMGRVFSVRDLAHKTDASSRRVQCQELTS